MNIKCIKLRWLIAVLTIAAIGGGYPAAQSYLETQSRIRSAQTANAVLDRLAQDQKLNTILKLLQTGAVEEATQRLNYLLCVNIVDVNSQLASVDDRGRAFAQNAFSRMAQCRPKPSPEALAAFLHGQRDEEIEAKKILALAVAADYRADGTSSASR
jgi:hypothetical protein